MRKRIGFAFHSSHIILLEVQQMFCPRCGAQNADDARFCRACGTDISLVPQAVTGQLAERLAAEEDYSRGSRRQRKRDREKGPPTIERPVRSFVMGVAVIVVA